MPAMHQTAYTFTTGFWSSMNNTDGFVAKVAHKTTLHLNLMAMPTGTVTTSTPPGGHDLVRVAMVGLTPGSSHTVLLHGNPIGTLTAGPTGQASATFTVNSIPGGSRVKILDGRHGTHLIAQTSPLGRGNGPYQLHALEAGFPQGSLQGHATLTYDPGARTITVMVTASGLTPGRHVAHIHLGSCQSQGPVQYTLMDFTADRHGNINHETRTVTGVTTALPATGWYLNLHQGNRNDILSNGQPTILFRPLLCANI
jgi:CHRD domain